MSIIKDVIEFMSNNPYVEFSAGDIAKKLIYEVLPEKHGHRNEKVMGSVINRDIKQMQDKGTCPKELENLVVDKKPRTYYWDNGNPELTDDFELIIKRRQKSSPKKATRQNAKLQTTTKPKTKETGKDEKGLYKPFVEYLRNEKGMFAKRIGENTSTGRRKGRDKWRHPDIVAVEGLISPTDIHPSIQKIIHVTSDRAKLYAYEIKEEITGRDLRDYFHQTVASTIWANFGYLCAERIDADKETDDELDQLSKAYGVGFMLIDRNDPENNHIVKKAKERPVDLDICNALAQTNKDFEKFINTAARVFENGIVEFY